MMRLPTLMTMVRVSASAILCSSPKSTRRSMIGMIVPRRLLTPTTYAGTSGRRVTLPGVTISWMLSM